MPVTTQTPGTAQTPVTTRTPTTESAVGGAGIIVGVDGSPGSDAALAWALEEARVRGSEVEALVVRSMRVASREHLSYDQLTPARCGQVLAESLERIGGPAGVPLRLETRDDDLLFELGLEASARGAGLVVVGRPSHRGHRGVPLPLLAHRLWCPLVCVPSGYVRHRTRQLVVDLEWAADNLEALRWAVGEARLTGAALEVVAPPCPPTGHRSAVADLDRRIGRVVAACIEAGIDASLVLPHSPGLFAPPSADLLVLDMPVRPWQRGGLPPKAQRSLAWSAGVPVVLVPVGAERRER